MAYLAEPVPTVPQSQPSGPQSQPPGPHDRPGPWLFVRPGGAAAGLPAGVVLFGRDGTLLQDVTCNGDPAMVRPMAGVRAALAALRAAGFALGVVSNQPGVARGLLGPGQVEAVQSRAEALLGPLDVWAVCPHGPHQGCPCRMPAPTLVTAACRALGLPPARVTVIGCSDAVIGAALAAGAHAIRVPEAAAPTTTGCPPCTLTTCRTADGPEQAAELVLRR
ncbi:HAD-IIIA family hydrolase [Streptomyces sp. NRRL S-350]|uniref:HAD-IIIA family hydrolase n=1 Tax=Streptomyces sp. NRRL S-350 TaxID=1463902 RepID=UPI00068FB96C|nr:HAD-IIIA family hydrolase [Streptomyces sp. NRRL S-350]